MLENDAINVAMKDDYDSSERHVIVVVPGDKSRIIDEVQQVIRNDVYSRDNMLIAVRREGGECFLEIMSREALDDLISRRCRFEKHVVSKNSGQVSIVPLATPKYVAETIHGMENWPFFREITQVRGVPFLRPDGSVGGLEPGYDEAANVYVNVPDGLQAPPDQPSTEDAMEALQKIREIFDEFPFDSEACESTVIAAILTIVARQYLREEVPLFIVESSQIGAGKTLLAKIIAQIGMGDSPFLTSGGGNDVQFRRMITGVLMSGRAVLVLDDHTGKTGGETLNRLQTSGKWTDRGLGNNRVVTLRNDIVTIVISNKMTIEGSTARRSLIVRLVPDCKHPESRVFRSPDLLSDVCRRRHELALAAITILRWHIARGCPENAARAFGSFEAWSRLVRQAVMHLGMPDPVGAQCQIYDPGQTQAVCGPA
jgi:hypothetical protein